MPDELGPREGRPSIGKYVKLSTIGFEAAIDAGSWIFAAMVLSAEIDCRRPSAQMLSASRGWSTNRLGTSTGANGISMPWPTNIAPSLLPADTSAFPWNTQRHGGSESIR